jgi:RND family efflux transporter MFP subunit
MPTMRKAILAAAVLSAAALAGAWMTQEKDAPKAGKPRNPEQPVTIAVATRRSLPIVVSANGYVTPSQTVEVRPREQNIVREVHVSEGQDVKAGQLLFTLDDRSDVTGVQRARAQLARDLADLEEAETALRRNQDLLAKGFVSQAVVDTARSRVNALKSTVQADRAAIEFASITAGYNRISASMTGRIGAINVHPGSLVQPAGTPMLTIARIDPVAVTFSLPERELAQIRATYPDESAPVIASLPGGAELKGALSFIDNAADAQSGTIRMKARFKNSDRRLWPGTFVPVTLVAHTIADAVTVPAQAVVNGPMEKFVYLVNADSSVEQQRVEVLAIVDALAAVSNVAPGARVVSEGMQNLRPGGKVREVGTSSRAGGLARSGE